MRIFLKLLLFFSGIYVLICTLVYFNQENLLFHPTTLSNSNKFTFDSPFEEISIPLSNEKSLSAVFLKAEKPKGTVLFFHGNAGNIQSFSEYYAVFLSENYNCAVFDYRGFGKSQGTIESEDQFYEDGRMFTNFIKQKYSEENLFVCGFSVGSAIAAKIAMEEKTKKLILLAPYYSMTELAGDKFPFVPGFLLKYKFDTFRFLEKIQASVLMVHGKNDGVIPSKNSDKLQKINPKRCKLIKSNSGHNDLMLNDYVVNEISAFLN